MRGQNDPRLRGELPGEGLVMEVHDGDEILSRAGRHDGFERARRGEVRHHRQPAALHHVIELRASPAARGLDAGDVELLLVAVNGIAGELLLQAADVGRQVLRHQRRAIQRACRRDGDGLEHPVNRARGAAERIREAEPAVGLAIEFLGPRLQNHFQRVPHLAGCAGEDGKQEHVRIVFDGRLEAHGLKVHEDLRATLAGAAELERMIRNPLWRYEVRLASASGHEKRRAIQARGGEPLVFARGEGKFHCDAVLQRDGNLVFRDVEARGHVRFCVKYCPPATQGRSGLGMR